MAHTATSLTALYQTTDGVLPFALTGVTNEVATTRIRDGQGPSISWTLGHLLHFRHHVVGLLGGTKEESFASFAKGGATDGSAGPDIAELEAAWERVGAALTERLAGASDDQLRQPSGGVGPHGEKTVLDEVVFLAWHEAYHLGSIGSIRTALGLRPTAELVMEAAGAATG
ncbi:MAG: DinB family protein [Vicinamibacterales bacterium]|jgi:uncharacterized damage-inducible protein DinB|nr:DinB family protein [Vicinamibacterales bacterium]